MGEPFVGTLLPVFWLLPGLESWQDLEWPSDVLPLALAVGLRVLLPLYASHAWAAAEHRISTFDRLQIVEAASLDATLVNPDKSQAE